MARSRPFLIPAGGQSGSRQTTSPATGQQESRPGRQPGCRDPDHEGKMPRRISDAASDLSLAGCQFFSPERTVVSLRRDAPGLGALHLGEGPWPLRCQAGAGIIETWQITMTSARTCSNGWP